MSNLSAKNSLHVTQPSRMPGARILLKLYTGSGEIRISLNVAGLTCLGG